MRARKVVDELSTLQSALLELSAAFELEPQHATEGGAATEEGGKKGGGERAAAYGLPPRRASLWPCSTRDAPMRASPLCCQR